MILGAFWRSGADKYGHLVVGPLYFREEPIEHWSAIVLTALAALGFVAGARIDE
jgi:hypothetical protein